MSSQSDSDPADTITRILFLSPNVHIYAVPPLSSNKGYTTTSWTPLTSPPTRQLPNPEPITTRLRVVESSTSTPLTAPTSQEHQDQDQQQRPHITTSILLEEQSTGALFAACPYTSPSSVLPVTDSTRFFALRVEGDGGRMKAVLGVGFEERTEAMDFGICLQGVRRVLGMDVADGDGGGARGALSSGKGRGNGDGGTMMMMKKKKDWGLKEGEMIRVEIGGKGSGLSGSNPQRKKAEEGAAGGGGEGAASALFSIKPPPPPTGQQQQPSHHPAAAVVGGLPFLPPPPSAKEAKEERRRSRGDGAVAPEKGSAADLGFDDGEFGEFQ